MHKSPAISELMNTDLRTAYQSELVEDVHFTMQVANVHHIPVLDREQQLVGIVSSRDLCASFHDPARAQEPISLFMKREVITVPPSAPAANVIRLMIEKSIGCVPVVADGGKLVGIVTETDFMQLALAHVTGRSCEDKAHPVPEPTGYQR